MGNDLVAIKVEVDPLIRTPSLFTAEQAPIKGTRGSEIMDRKREMERPHFFPAI